MSGICGIVHLDGSPVEAALLNQMAQAMSYRGPDGIHTWLAGNVGLAHLALHTTPEAQRERQPSLNKTGDLALTADARIDNRTELIHAIAARAQEPMGLGDPSALAGNPTPTDADLILAAYEAWGEACPAHLHGDFAFAIWDTPQQRLFCARDRFGVRSFYYHLSKTTFAFATEIKALLCLPWVLRRVNETMIMVFLSDNLSWDKTSTFYQDIVGLAPAHTLTIKDEQAKPRSYWTLDPQRELRLPSDEAYADAFNELFSEAVHCRLRRASPIGAALSGGLDSSSIACTARRLLAGKENLYTFSCIFDQVPESDEREYMQAVLALDGFDPVFIRGDLTSPFNNYEEMLAHLDAPLVVPNLYLHWSMYREAHARGVRVFLDGYAGDQVVGHGLGRITELARFGHWISLVREALKAAHSFEHPWWWYLYYRAALPLVPQPVRSLGRWLKTRQSASASANRERFLNPQFAHRYPQPLNPPYSYLTAREEHYHGLTTDSQLFALETADRASAAFAIEPRFPFLDARLAEFCLSLPAGQKLRQGYSRYVMRRAMQDWLPEAIRWRTGKVYLGHNFRRQLLHRDRPLLERALVEDRYALEPYLQLEAVQELWDRSCRVNGLTCYTRDILDLLWKATGLGLWLPTS
jgi:asparagine synthase (glutamine-hydrolysing)